MPLFAWHYTISPPDYQTKTSDFDEIVAPRSVDALPAVCYNEGMELFVNGVTLFWRVCGTGAPLILLHGNGESHEIFNEAIPLLAQRFTVYAADTRGHGKSSPVTEYRYTDMADDLLAAADTLRLQRPFVYGFSDGGITALLAAIAQPERFERIAVSGVNLAPRGLNGAFLRETRRALRKTHDPLLQLMLTQPQSDLRALGAVRAPVTLLYGEHDLVRPAHAMRIAAALPNCTLRVLAGETHESYVVHSQTIAHILLDLLPA